MIIAVDGPAAAGKGTVARAIARHFGLHFLDTGSLYRMVGLAVLRRGKAPEDAEAAVEAARMLNPQAYDDLDLRSETVGAAASVVATMPMVREALLDYQRAFARKPPGAVLDGRDIGTVVCPDADAKLFITASPEERARRRLQEASAQSAEASYEDVLADILARDRRDKSRMAAPLIAAADAVVIDTTEMSVDEAIAAAIRHVELSLRGQAINRTQAE